MKPLGIVRSIDELGRLVIPIEVRRELGWPEGTPLEVFASVHGVFVRKYVPSYEHSLPMSLDSEIDAIRFD